MMIHADAAKSSSRNTIEDFANKYKISDRKSNGKVVELFKSNPKVQEVQNGEISVSQGQG